MLLGRSSLHGSVCRIPGSPSVYTTIKDARGVVVDVIVAVEDETTDMIVRAHLRSPGLDPEGKPLFIIPPEFSSASVEEIDGKLTITKIWLT